MYTVFAISLSRANQSIPFHVFQFSGKYIKNLIQKEVMIAEGPHYCFSLKYSKLPIAKRSHVSCYIAYLEVLTPRSCETYV